MLSTSLCRFSFCHEVVWFDFDHEDNWADSWLLIVEDEIDDFFEFFGHWISLGVGVDEFFHSGFGFFKSCQLVFDDL